MNTPPPAEQPEQDSAPLSIADRAANIFGDDSPEPQETAQETDAPSEAQESEPETFEHEVEGEKYVLPKKLEKSLMQERDYTQKSQQLADQRRSVELKEQQFRTRELESKFHNDVSAEIRQMQLIDEVLKQPVNWQSMGTDEAFRHKIQLDDLRTQREQISQTVSQKYNQFREQQAKEFQALQNKTLEVVRQRIPNWNDTTAKEVTEHFRSRGLTDADFNLFNSNAEFIQTAWESMQYRKLQAKAKPTVEQAKSVKTTSSNPMPKDVKDRLSFRKAMQKAKPGTQERRHLIEDRVANIFGR